VNEVDLARVPIGAPARVFLDGWPDAPYPGRVSEIAPTANRQKATVQVKVLVFEPDDRIRPEMSARVVVLDAPEGKPPAGAKPAPRVLAPRDALREGGAAVFVVENGVARRRPVKTGGTEGDRVVILEGLAGNETLVTGEVPELRDGARVRVRNR
jgi:multidrug efflux pump subunit AcrA (membrane-fusion protein)